MPNEHTPSLEGTIMSDENKNPFLHHNNPPPDTPEELRKNLKFEHADIIERREALLESAKRMPEIIESADIADKFTDNIKLIKALAVEAKKLHEKIKAPFAARGKVVDTLFKHEIENVMRAKAKELEKPLTVWQEKIAKEARLKREEEARLEAEKAAEDAAKAQRLADEALAALNDDSNLDDAVDKEEAAEAATLEAQDAAEHAQEVTQQTSSTKADSRINATYGAQASLVSRVTHEIKHPRIVDLEALRKYMTTDMLDMLARAHIKAHKNDLDKIPPIKGIRFFKPLKSRVR